MLALGVPVEVPLPLQPGSGQVEIARLRYFLVCESLGNQRPKHHLREGWDIIHFLKNGGHPGACRLATGLASLVEKWGFMLSHAQGNHNNNNVSSLGSINPSSTSSNLSTINHSSNSIKDRLHRRSSHFSLYHQPSLGDSSEEVTNSHGRSRDNVVNMARGVDSRVRGRDSRRPVWKQSKFYKHRGRMLSRMMGRFMILGQSSKAECILL